MPELNLTARKTIGLDLGIPTFATDGRSAGVFQQVLPNYGVATVISSRCTY